MAEKKVMVVDDSTTVRQLMVKALRSVGYSVLEACNGREALVAIGREPVDMLITDLNMPGMNGIELIEAVRAQGGKRFLPIVMMSSEDAKYNRPKARAAGASAWMNKPFKPEQLQAVVRMVIG
jgi:two-component system chemotaxis response regulator CheY